MNNHLRDILEFDAEKSFGDCLFLSADGEREDRLDDGTDGVIKRFYLVLSGRQEEQLRVGIPVSVPPIDLPRKTPVKLVGVARVVSIPEQGYNGKLNNYIDVENIVKLEKGAAATQSPKSASNTPGGASQHQSSQGEKK